jgi:hypothetical protein
VLIFAGQCAGDWSLTILRSILAHCFHWPVKTALLFLTGQCAMCAACYEEFKRKEEKMPLFTIMHIYEVSAKNQYDATDELMRAREGKYEKVYLKKVLVKDAEELTPFRHKVNVFEPKERTKMVTIFRRQLFGK